MSDFKAKMHQSFIGWGSAPDRAGGGRLTALPRPTGSGGKGEEGRGRGSEG